MIDRILAASALAIALGGCTYVHSYFAESDMAEAKAFCETLRSDPAIRPVASKLPLISPDEITPEMLAIDATPTDAELGAINALAKDQQQCRRRIRAVVKEHEPTLIATQDELNMKLDLVTAQLLQKKMSYGNANRLYRQAALEASNKLTEQAKQDLANAEEREDETWRSIGRGLADAAKPSVPRADKSCSWVDSSVNCNSR
ncbi:MAG: hypothetical protein GC190_05010 [Alphaproteobacteria bacterium]|nr:hypothetical protein [Alphaproteobacteria bacterium]